MIKEIIMSTQKQPVKPKRIQPNELPPQETAKEDSIPPAQVIRFAVMIDPDDFNYIVTDAETRGLSVSELIKGTLQASKFLDVTQQKFHYFDKDHDMKEHKWTRIAVRYVYTFTK
jgi:hypothetical protein